MKPSKYRYRFLVGRYFFLRITSFSCCPLVLDYGHKISVPNPARVFDCGAAVIIPHADPLERCCCYARDMIP